MARPLRIEYPVKIYHITSRGNARGAIFLSDPDRNRFLSILSDVTEQFRWICYAYCLMSNHYHILIETTEANLSKGMRQLNGVYTQAVNRHHNRSGHVFQGRYKSILIQKQNYLLELCRYIVLNPVRAGLVDSPDAWQWSSFRATAGISEKLDFLSVDWIRAQFSDSRSKAKGLYRKFVYSGIGKATPWKELKAGVFAGSDSFLDEIKDSIRATSSEIPKRQRHAAHSPLTDIIPIRERATDEQIIAARRQGYSLQEIGNYLSLHYATVSRRASRGKREGEYLNAKNKT